MSMLLIETTITTGTEYVRSRAYASPCVGEEIVFRASELGSENESYELKVSSLGRGEDYVPSLDEAGSTMEARKSVEISLKELVQTSLKKLGVPMLSVEIRYDEHLGLYALAILDCDARQALEYWLRIVDTVKSYGIPVFVAWTGRNDVSPEEMGSYIGRALAKMSVFLSTREPLDVAKILEEEWSSST